MGTRAAMKRQRKLDAIERASKVSVATWEDSEGAGKENIIIRGGNVLKNAPTIASKMPHGYFVVTSEANLRRTQEEALLSTAGLPEKLYHVTYSKNVNGILARGLAPRSVTGLDNWAEKQQSSHAEHVYLTEANVLRYAAMMWGKVEYGKVALVEVDASQLQEDLLYPDEDYISTLGANDFKADTFAADTAAARDEIDKHQDKWRSSLAGYGNVAYRGVIPPSALKVHYLECNAALLAQGDYFLAAYPYFREELKAQLSVLDDEP